MIVDVERGDLLHRIDLAKLIGMLLPATLHQAHGLYVVWYLLQVQRY